MVRRIEQRILKIEERLKHVDEPSGILIYDSNDPSGADELIKKFYERHPNYAGELIILPAIDRDERDDE